MFESTFQSIFYENIFYIDIKGIIILFSYLLSVA